MTSNEQQKVLKIIINKTLLHNHWNQRDTVESDKI